MMIVAKASILGRVFRRFVSDYSPENDGIDTVEISGPVMLHCNASEDFTLLQQQSNWSFFVVTVTTPYA
jgi:hypothetical protein